MMNSENLHRIVVVANVGLCNLGQMLFLASNVNGCHRKNYVFAKLTFCCTEIHSVVKSLKAGPLCVSPWTAFMVILEGINS